MHDQGENDFKWQAGYGWFGVGANDIDRAKNYVADQKNHHQALSFQDEFRNFLVKYQIPFDEQYLWD